MQGKKKLLPVHSLSPGGHRGKMPSAWVRALCAQIAIELDPEKVELLTTQLAEVILREYLSGAPVTDQEPATMDPAKNPKVH